MIKKSIIKIGTVVMIALCCLFVLSACGSDTVKHTVLEVTNSKTSEVVKNKNAYEFDFDGQQKVFTTKVKIKDTTTYLADGDLKNNNLNDHIVLYVKAENEAGYATVKEWPSAVGKYEVLVMFNNHFPDETVENDENYYPSRLQFTIIINEAV